MHTQMHMHTQIRRSASSYTIIIDLTYAINLKFFKRWNATRNTEYNFSSNIILVDLSISNLLKKKQRYVRYSSKKKKKKRN